MNIYPEDVVGLLRDACEKAGSQRAWATSHGFSPAYISDVLNRRRDPSETVAIALGLVRETVYRKKTVK
jgi:hypothetical protein